MRFFSMFSGVGGFEIGIKRAYERSKETQPADSADGESEPSQHGGCPLCIGFSEIDPHASAVLRHHYPDVKNYGDCTQIQWSEVPDFDLLVGGSPCQDFSIAGKRAGLVGARSGLAYEYIRALEEKKPSHFIWENVRGVLSSNKGWDFGAILNQMAEAGYSLQWQVLNAKHFGVPQNRERVFVIGTRLGGASPREVFFEREDDGAGTETTHRKQGGGPGAALTRESAGGGNARGNYESVGSKIRRLMPLECERLMSWPDGHTSMGRKEDGTEYEVSDTQRYKMCGNGVVSEVVAAIVREMYNPPLIKRI